MENCKNCKHCSENYDAVLDMFYYMCRIANEQVLYPFLMGGSRKCECYERNQKRRFEYPKVNRDDK